MCENKMFDIGPECPEWFKYVFGEFTRIIKQYLFCLNERNYPQERQPQFLFNNLRILDTLIKKIKEKCKTNSCTQTDKNKRKDILEFKFENRGTSVVYPSEVQ